MTIQEYWAEVRQVQKSLPEAVFMVSLRNKEKGINAGAICECDAETAAKMIVEKTHELASEKQIEAWTKAQDAERAKHQAIELERRKQFAMPQELTDLVRLALAGQPRQQGQKETKQ
jgi:hypothetical protein